MKLTKYIQQDNEYDYIKTLINQTGEGVHGYLFVGPPGTGKTLCARNLAEREFDCPYHIIDGSPQLDRRDLEGTWQIVNNETKFVNGALISSIKDANKHGLAMLIFNEPNALRPSEQISFNSLMAENHINAISKSNERYELKDNCKLIVIGTMNMNVSGINNLQDAFDDRFELVLDFEYPNKQIETEILQATTGATRQQCELTVEIAEELRKGARQLSLSKYFSTRMGVNFLTTVKNLNKKWVDKTIETAILNKLATDQKDYEYIKDVMLGKDFKHKFKKTF